MKYFSKISNKVFNVLCVCWFVVPIVLEQSGVISLRISYIILMSFTLLFPMVIQEFHYQKDERANNEN